MRTMMQTLSVLSSRHLFPQNKLKFDQQLYYCFISQNQPCYESGFCRNSKGEHFCFVIVVLLYTCRAVKFNGNSRTIPFCLLLQLAHKQVSTNIVLCVVYETAAWKFAIVISIEWLQHHTFFCSISLNRTANAVFFEKPAHNHHQIIQRSFIAVSNTCVSTYLVNRGFRTV